MIPAAMAHIDQPLRLGEGKRPQQHAVDDAEDGGRSANADRQRQHRDSREPRLLREHTRGIPKVLPEIGQRVTR